MHDWNSREELGLGLLLSAIPLTYAVAAAVPAGARRGLRSARTAAATAVSLALLAATALASHGPIAMPALGLRLDVLGAVMLALVTFIGLVIAQFSRAYLDGDRGLARYERWLMATLSAVTLLVLTNDLVVLALAWLATSLSLHQLLTFYRERSQAAIAAHKKFLVSRLGDVCIFAAVGLVGTSVGTTDIDQIGIRLGGLAVLPPGVSGAAVLIAAGAMLKTAQLPFHGWLIQVMEAPTPVSALLHAGVVNIGGFVLIRLAPMMARAETAQTLLVVVGGLTMVVAALVMTTRVSVKVHLAWSTCAQMGFLLVQCGLGAYSLALLHLVAHSLYKAHAFLRAGSVVAEWRVHALTPARTRVALGPWLGTAAAALGAVALVAFAFRADPRREPALFALLPMVGFALTPLLVAGARRGRRDLEQGAARGPRVVRVVFASITVAALYLGWHALARRTLVLPVDVDALVSAPRIVIALAAFVTLFAGQTLLQVAPEAPVAQALHRHLFAGLYLDELFTRLTFRVWPARLTPKPAARSRRLEPMEVEARG